MRGSVEEELFDRIAPSYDFLKRTLSLGLYRSWNSSVVDLLDLNPGSSVLDIGAGTGDLSLGVADRYGSYVVAVDSSRSMLSEFERKTEEMELTRPVMSDAGALPFRGDVFDAVICSYVLRYIGYEERFLEEMARVGMTGSRVVYLDLARPSSGTKRALQKTYLRRVLPLVGALGDRVGLTTSYLAQELSNFPDSEGIEKLEGRFRKVFSDVETSRPGLGTAVLVSGKVPIDK